MRLRKKLTCQFLQSHTCRVTVEETSGEKEEKLAAAIETDSESKAVSKGDNVIDSDASQSGSGPTASEEMTDKYFNPEVIEKDNKENDPDEKKSQANVETGEGSDVMSPVDVKALLVNQLKSLSTKVAVKNSSDRSSSVGCLGLLSVSSSIFPTSVSRCVSSPAPTYDVEEVRSTVGSSLPSVTESVGTLVGSTSTNVSALVVVNKASSSSSSRGGSVSPSSLSLQWRIKRKANCGLILL